MMHPDDYRKEANLKECEPIADPEPKLEPEPAIKTIPVDEPIASSPEEDAKPPLPILKKPIKQIIEKEEGPKKPKVKKIVKMDVPV